ncbi:MAG: DUF6273 domain-containing protein [Eubacterium sp.]
MAAKTKVKEVKLTDEEKYAKAKELTQAVNCLTRDKERAEIYGTIAKKYRELGDYEDSAKLAEEAEAKAKEFKKKADANKKNEKKPDNFQEEEKKSNGVVRKIVLGIILVVIVVGIVGVIFSQTKQGRYVRASYYEKVGNYEKSYKMFNNLKSYKDSQDRATLSKYEYGIDCKKNDEYEVAKNTLRSLGDYKDSEAQLCELELNNIDKSEIGTSVLFGEYKWLILEKKQGKAFLVKSEPIPGYAYNDENISVTWEKSSLRKFLNSDFIDETFSESQKSKILETKISIPLNSQSKTKGGKETTDKLFMLNAEQANRYEEILSNYTRDWWLIDAGISDNTAQFVSNGKVMDYGYEVSSQNINIRPAMWIQYK